MRVNCAECIRKDDCITVGGRPYGSIIYPLSREQNALASWLPAVKKNQSLTRLATTAIEISLAYQLALALSFKSRGRPSFDVLAMVNERTVIARELHDSLAQALSYLKIQVTTLEQGDQGDIKNEAIIRDVSQELREGLDSAYRQLRELLTTFRLKG